MSPRALASRSRLETMEASLRTELDALCRTACALLSVPMARIYLDAPGGEQLAASHGPDCPQDGALEPSHPDAMPIGPQAQARFPAGPGQPAGRLVLMDRSARSLSEAQQRQLDDLAAIAAGRINAQSNLIAASEQAALYRLLADNSTDTIVRGDLDGIRRYISPAVKTLLGYEPEELIGKRASEIVHPDDAKLFAVLMGQVRNGQIELGRTEQRQRHKDGHWVWLEAYVKLTRDKITGEPDGYVASVRDIGARKAIELRLSELASHDPLTGLPNRTLFRDTLDRQLAQAAATDQCFAVLCLDLDRFKPVNDNFGHQAGDAVLIAAATRFRTLVRAGDTVARLGGDEFIIIQTIEGDSAASAAQLAERLIAAMAAPVDCNGQSIWIGVSIGIALAGPACLDADKLLDAADQALYRAKKAGRNTYRLA